jgi:hypothetical protein
VGDRGKILIDEQGLRFWEFTPSIGEYTRTTDSMWSGPKATLKSVPLPKGETGHIAITRNFCQAILRGDDLIAPGAEGIASLELANAMILSSYRKKRVKMPLKRNEYEGLLDELKRKSRPKGRVTDRRVTDTAISGGKEK